MDKLIGKIIALLIVLLAIVAIYGIYYFALYKIIVWFIGVVHHAWTNSGHK